MFSGEFTQIQYIQLCLLAAAGLVLLYIMYSDTKALRIPNYATLALFLLGIGFGIATKSFNWLSHIGAFALLFLICFSLFHFGLLGGGDTKLIPVMGFWVGFAHLLPFLLMMTLSGAVLGIAIAVFTAVRGRKLSASEESKSAWRKKAMPYGVAIGLTGIAYLGFVANGIIGL